MASAQRDQTPPLENHLTCPICKEMFKEPVVTSCGHSFCKTCLRSSFNSSNNNCPLCNQPQRQFPSVNISLRDVIQQLQNERAEQYHGRPGEVACDVCGDPRLRAVKSCLVCLTSYCSNHLENHRSAARLSGHKLVEPVENLDQRACATHGRPLELYTRSQQRTMCARCVEEGQEQVVSIEDECDRKKAELDRIKMDIRRKIGIRQRKVDDINESLRRCKNQLESEWCEIDAVFMAVLAIVEAAQRAALQPMANRQAALEREAKKLTDNLQAEIRTMEDAITDLNRRLSSEDHIYFVQTYPNLQNMDNFSETVDGHLDESLIFGTMRNITSTMLGEIQQKLDNLTAIELKRIPQFSVDVKLDPATAHRRLLVSDDRKRVRDTGVDQEVLDSPERFDVFASVMGLNRLNGGRAYWEVQVANKTGWDVGVASVQAQRRGNLTFIPNNGYWMTVHYGGEHYVVLSDPQTPLRLTSRPQRLGVFVDYNEGLVSFYDLTTQSHIYSFSHCAFQDDLVPYFSPHPTHEQNADPLIVLHGPR